MTIVFLSSPLLIDIAAVWRWRGSYRYGAMIPLPFLLLAYAVDVYGFIQGGNLSGLFTILVTFPTLLLLLVLSVAQAFARPDAATSEGGQPAAQRTSMIMLALLVMIVIGVVIFVLIPTR